MAWVLSLAWSGSVSQTEVMCLAATASVDVGYIMRGFVNHLPDSGNVKVASRRLHTSPVLNRS